MANKTHIRRLEKGLVVRELYEDQGSYDALVVKTIGGGEGGGGGATEGADAIGTPLTANPVVAGGIDWDDNVQPTRVDEDFYSYVNIGNTEIPLFAKHREFPPVMLSGSGNGSTSASLTQHSKSAYILVNVSGSTLAGGRGLTIQINAVDNNDVEFTVFESPLITANGKYVYLISESAIGNAAITEVSNAPLPDNFLLRVIEGTDGTGTATYTVNLRPMV